MVSYLDVNARAGARFKFSLTLTGPSIDLLYTVILYGLLLVLAREFVWTKYMETVKPRHPEIVNKALLSDIKR